MCIDDFSHIGNFDYMKDYEPAPIRSSDEKYRIKNRDIIRLKAAIYRENNKDKKNEAWKLARRKQRENETIEQREIRLAKRRLYRKNKTNQGRQSC